MKPHADDGFTLAETLIALMVVSLALASILAATNLVTRFNQLAARREVSIRQADAVTAQLTEAMQAYQPGKTYGTRSKLDFACGDGKACHFFAPSGVRLAYASGGNLQSDWAEPLAQNPSAPRLEALILLDRSGTTLGTVRLEVEQSGSCQFDMISRRCRGEGQD